MILNLSTKNICPQYFLKLKEAIKIKSHEKEFWNMLDELCRNHKIVIDRPKNSRHPKYPQQIYPLDYGFLRETSSGDGKGIDVWVGSAEVKAPSAVITSVDLLKADSEIKILYACTSEEISMVYEFHNCSDGMKGLLNVRKEFD